MLVSFPCFLMVSHLAVAAQPGWDPSTWTPPPLVDAPEEATPPTPPPADPPARGGATPDAPPASPFAPTPVPRPEGPEVGLMITESLFGMVTAAGVSLIPYFLLKVVPEAFGGTDDPTLQVLVLILTFSGVPLAVSQTEMSIAQSSRYYDVEGWPAPLGGLLAQAAVLGLFFHLRQSPDMDASTTEVVLLGGTVVAVPLVEMAMINLFKVPRSRLPPPRAVVTAGTSGLRLGLPVPRPFVAGRTELGLQVPVVAGTF